MKSKWVDPDDAPELTGDELDRADATWRIAGRKVTSAEGRTAFRAALRRKTRVNIHIDNDLIEFYKAQAGGRGYQTLINSALRRDMEGQTIAKTVAQTFQQGNDELLRVIREALRNLPAQNVLLRDATFAGARGQENAVRIGSLQRESIDDAGVQSATHANSAQPVFGPLTWAGGHA